MYYEIYKQGNLIRRGTNILNTLSWSTELMFTPNMELVLPIDHLEYFQGREEVKVFVNDKCFWGIAKGIVLDKENETISVTLEHVISEWEYRQVHINHAVDNKELNTVYKGDNVNRDKNTGETITASDFTVTEGELPLTDAQIISKSKASAWVSSNGDKVSITSVSGEIKKEKGEYDVTLKTAKGTTITIKCSVSDEVRDTDIDPSIVDKISDIYNDRSFVYKGWIVDIEDSAKDEMIDYVYSRQNKLEALTKTCELTKDLFWRVTWKNEKVVEIGKFGVLKPYVISARKSGETNIRMITEPTITYDYDEVINVASVYGDKSDSGMSSITLRDVYERPELQDSDFPVVILREAVNNERDYSEYIQFPMLAPNNYDEYAIIDLESVALENGELLEGTFAYNDISAFSVDDKIVTDADRINASVMIRNAGARKLRQSRRGYAIEVETEEIPSDLNVGDKVLFRYGNRIWNIDACSEYYKHILSYDDEYYITRIDYEIDETGAETNRLTLTKWIRIERETQEE